MKRIPFYLGIAAAMVASCTREKDIQTPVQEEAAFCAFFEQPTDAETKVYATEDLFLRWNADDRIGIFNKNTYNQQYMFTGETGDNAGGFRKVDADKSVSGNPISHVVSVYPYQDETKITKSETLTLTLPENQCYEENGFGVGANTMVSVSDGNVLQYKNVGGYLVLKLYGEGVTVSSITLKGNGGEKIAGEATVTMSSDGTPSTVLEKNSTGIITLVCDTPVQLGATEQESKLFWFVVPPMTFSKGFTITVEDPDGGPFVKSSSESVAIERNRLSRISPMEVGPNYNKVYVPFEDERFKRSCVSNFDTNNDGKISVIEAGKATTLSVKNSKITSLSGIEYFSNLTDLDCSNNRLKALDVSNNTNLKTLLCSGNQLTDLDVSNNILLKQLECNDNQLTSLDVSKNVKLTALHCENNQLNSLDVSKHTDLKELYCENNQLNNLDVSRNTALTHLNCENTHLASLNVSSNLVLKELWCDNNQISSLDVHNNTELDFLNCTGNLLKSLDVSYNKALKWLWCSENQLTSLDVSNNTRLLSLYFWSTQLTSVDLSKNTKLMDLRCEDTLLTRLDVSNNKDLSGLSCYDNPYLTEIWLSAWQEISNLDYDEDIAFVRYKPEIVDMGLSVKWASFNLGASRPEEYGDYYAWGETETYYGPRTWREGNEDGYAWTTYKWRNGSNLIKYNTSSSLGTVDNKTVLDPSDDAAHAALGGSWRMPTAEEFKELFEMCTYSWGSNYSRKGLWLTSKKNGKELFFPMAGCYYETGHAAETQGLYWSSSLDPESPEHAFYIFLDSSAKSKGVTSDAYYRFAGFSIRPVCTE